MRRGRRRTITDARALAWAALYRAGLSTRAIAAREAVSNGCVREYLARAGVRFRPQGRPRAA